MAETRDPGAVLADRYRAFAADEAHGVSPSYERLALEIADSPEVLGFLASLPSPRRQPNLLLGAARLLGGRAPDIGLLTELVRRRDGALRNTMLTRTTQTNEPARCAVLLPALAALPGPLALIEVGASAGLCLLPDRYGYDYGQVRIAAPQPASLVFRCDVQGPVPFPAALPRIVWRAGLDLNPLDLGSAEDIAWLDALIWPEQEHRRQRLSRAVAVARGEPPRIVRGDLLEDLDGLIAEAPRDATLVLFHSAVLAYVTPLDARLRFAESVQRSRATWISNEVPAVFPAIAAQVPGAVPPGRFLLAVDGVARAWSGPHGQSLDWIA